MRILKSIIRYFRRTSKGWFPRIFVTLVLFIALMLNSLYGHVYIRNFIYLNFGRQNNGNLSWLLNSRTNATVSSVMLYNETVSEKVKEVNVSTRILAFSNITLKPEFVAMINASVPKYAIDASYLIENPTLCSSVTNLTVLIIVHTAPSHFEHRQVIRQTWANNKCYINLGVVRILFLLGLVQNEHLQKGLEEEFRQHEDLLQGNFIDDYHNLTHKGVMAYKWITERCRNAKIILKTDDDVVINMYLFLSAYAPKYISQGRQIMCKHFIGDESMIVVRKRRSKWFVNKNQFRNYTHYPAYCQGFMVMFTNDIIPDLYKSAKITPFFWIDDVFLYGIVPANVPDIHFNTMQYGTHVMFRSERAIKKYKIKKRKHNFLAVVGNYELSKEVWSCMTKRQIFDSNSKSTCNI